MKKRNEKFFLSDINNSVEKILRYSHNLSFDDFYHDEKTIDAIERNFEIIGEAVKNISVKTKNKYPNVPFKQIAGMRDKLIHDYFGVDYEIIYETIKKKLPEFKLQIEKIIKEYEQQGN